MTSALWLQRSISSPHLMRPQQILTELLTFSSRTRFRQLSKYCHIAGSSSSVSFSASSSYSDHWILEPYPQWSHPVSASKMPSLCWWFSEFSFQCRPVPWTPDLYNQLLTHHVHWLSNSHSSCPNLHSWFPQCPHPTPLPCKPASHTIFLTSVKGNSIHPSSSLSQNLGVIRGFFHILYSLHWNSADSTKNTSRI